MAVRRLAVNFDELNEFIFDLDWGTADGWTGRCRRPVRHAELTVTGANADELVDAVQAAVTERFGRDAGVLYRYTTAGWDQACAEHRADPRSQAVVDAQPVDRDDVAAIGYRALCPDCPHQDD